jgi:non-ribosomal peptide synthase protein (TIGR01720 family)
VANSDAPAETAVAQLAADHTTTLLHDAGQAYHTTVEEMLLAALLQALWRCDVPAVRQVDVESHGREHPLAGVDISRTAGWFTTVFPLRLAVAGDAPSGALLLGVKEQYRAVPWRGFHYGVLRWLRADTAPRLAALPESPLLFNYLGRFDGTVPHADGVGVRLVAGGLSADPAARPRYPVEANALVAGGRLELRVTAVPGVGPTAEQVARAWHDALDALIAHCNSPDAGGYSPSDFPRARLSASQLDRALAELAADGLED